MQRYTMKYQDGSEESFTAEDSYNAIRTSEQIAEDKHIGPYEYTLYDAQEHKIYICNRSYLR
jgi:hypothetical protein